MALFSSYWYRVGPLKPRLRSHCRIHRHVLRGQVWYVVEDAGTGRYFRFPPAAYQIVGLMDGRRTVEEIWQAVAARLGDDLPTQDEVIALLARLHQADVLITDTVPNVAEIAERGRRRRRQMSLQRLTNPFSIKVPLLDPDAFLSRWLPLVRPLFSGWGFALWVVFMGYALLQTGLHWNELTHNLIDRVLAFENILLTVLVYPLVKAAHELGHGFAVKRWGGEVHEVGVIFLIFIPVPYVDATASTGWPEKWRRITVASMGIVVELTLAALALLVWIGIEPGLTRAVAFSVMITAGVSTLLFNGNPLLRFDGYYAFSDAIEIPNLGRRANAYIGFLFQRYAFGRKEAQSPAISAGEAPWLFSYAIAAFCYRIVIVTGIILLVADSFFALGTLLAILAVLQMVVIPLAKTFAFVIRDPGLMTVRRRALSVTAVLLLLVAALVFTLPVPYRMVAQGIVWRPDQSRILAAAPGFIESVLVQAGEHVAARQPVARLSNSQLSARVAELDGKVKALQASLTAVVTKGPTAMAQVREQLAHANAALTRARRRVAELTVSAPANGRFVPELRGDPGGRYLRQGDLIGYALDPSSPTILRVAVPESQADLIRARTRSLLVRFADRQQRTYRARIVRQVPAAEDSLPSAALSTIGAGPFAIDPQEPKRLRTLERIFVFECEVLDAPPLSRIGGRAFVRFDLGQATLATQIYRPIRQLVLKQMRI
ncbi:MAG: PqqD family peptide modification chaperone [Hyphomicrobiales bacterium]|nr:PqqD family peptide modification chaperone [Hyphomicrobiales bacterium]